MRLLSFKC